MNQYNRAQVDLWAIVLIHLPNLWAIVLIKLVGDCIDSFTGLVGDCIDSFTGHQFRAEFEVGPLKQRILNRSTHTNI